MALELRRLLAAALVAALATVVVPAAPHAFGDGEDGEPGGDGADGDDGEDGEDGADGEDGEDGEDGGDGAGAPAAEKPTLENPLEAFDTKGYVCLKVPRSWATPSEVEFKGTLVGLFAGMMTERFPGHVEMHVDSRFARAPLALGAHLASIGSAEAAEARQGPGWAEGFASFENRRRKLVCWERAVEKDGAVYAVRIFTFAKAKDAAREMVRQMLDSVQVRKTVPAQQAPSGLGVRKAGAYDVWTDSDDKGRVGKVADWAASARDAAVKALKGKPFDESRPVLKPFQLGTHYIDATQAAYGTAPDYAAFDPITRSVAVQLHRIDHDDAPPAIRTAAARQYVAQYFGGETPIWIDAGLARYSMVAAEAGGKADKPASRFLEEAKSIVVQKSRKLDAWMDLTGASTSLDPKTEVPELWAWHFFLRHGSRKYAKQYQACLDALRQSGDLAAARKAWEGVDFDAMHREFKDFALKWK